MNGYTITIGSLINAAIMTKYDSVRLSLLINLDQMVKNITPQVFIDNDTKNKFLANFKEETEKQDFVKCFIPCQKNNIVTPKSRVIA